MSNEPHRRCFVALDLPEPLHAEALRVQLALREQVLFQGRFTAPENLHLTLKFLGEIPESTVAEARAALAGIRFKAPTLRLSGAGMFAPRIVWVRVAGAEELQRAVDAALENLFKPEARFMGHLTIARVKSARNPRGLASVVESLPVKLAAADAVSFSLRESRLQPEGPKYTVLETCRMA